MHGTLDVSLQLLGTGVTMHIAMPLDTDTPGFAEENKTKVLALCFSCVDMVVCLCVSAADFPRQPLHSPSWYMT